MRPVLPRRPLDVAAYPVAGGQVFIVPVRCKGCNYCIEFCPRDVLIESDARNAKGYRYPVVAEDKADACVHCQFCSLVCPEFAIYTEETEPVLV